MQLFINNWSSSLELPATASAVQLSVPSADAALLVGLAAGGYYLLTLAQVDANGTETAWEIVRVTGNTAGVLDVLRGQEGTTALELEAGTVISARLTRATMEELRDNGGPALSDAVPQAPGAAAAGTSPDASRADHVHDLPTPAAIGAATTAQGDLAETAVQPAALSAALDGKVDKLAGYGLSQTNFTQAEKDKLAGLESSRWKGLFATLAALQAAFPTAAAGDYADVDTGVGADVQRYLWDVDDAQWVVQAAGGGSMTPAEVKAAYESNADTNAYTDAEKAKLAGVAAGATANDNTDSLAEGSSNLYHTAARVRAVVLTGLSLAVGTAVAATDTVLEAFGKLQKQITDLTATVAGKQATLVSGTNIKTVNGASLLGGGDLPISGASLPAVSTFTGNLTLALTDINKYRRSADATAQTVTLPAQATVAWTADAEIHIEQGAAGAVTITAAAGVTINGVTAGSFTLAGQYAAATFKRVGSDAWTLLGGLANSLVSGPASAGNGNLALFDGATGKLIKDGGVVTPAGLALLDDASASAQRATLGVGAGDSPTFNALTLTSGQIVFPATQVPSANANTLDDYEEGTWTPVLTFATPGDLSVAYSAQAGTYTKIGNRVFVDFDITTSSFTHTTASGAVQVTGMPYPSSATIQGISSWAGITKAGYTDICMLTNIGTTIMELRASGSGVAIAQVLATDMPSGGAVRVRGAVAYR